MPSTRETLCLPSFPVTLHTGELSSLQATLGQQGLILFFYPKNNTPACRQEALDFAEHHAQFEALGYTVLGVSKDGARSHSNVIKKHALPFALVSDPEQQLCRHFDVIQPKKLYGREYLGIERSTFLLDQSGQVQRAWRALRVPGHVESVLAEAQTLSASAG